VRRFALVSVSLLISDVCTLHVVVLTQSRALIH
jgi:hypothetical protein